jgi:hypothetical protein
MVSSVIAPQCGQVKTDWRTRVLVAFRSTDTALFFTGGVSRLPE